MGDDGDWQEVRERGQGRGRRSAPNGRGGRGGNGDHYVSRGRGQGRGQGGRWGQGRGWGQGQGRGQGRGWGRGRGQGRGQGWGWGRGQGRRGGWGWGRGGGRGQEQRPPSKGLVLVFYNPATGVKSIVLQVSENRDMKARGAPENEYTKLDPLRGRPEDQDGGDTHVTATREAFEESCAVLDMRSAADRIGDTEIEDLFIVEVEVLDADSQATLPPPTTADLQELFAQNLAALTQIGAEELGFNLNETLGLVQLELNQRLFQGLAQNERFVTIEGFGQIRIARQVQRLLAGLERLLFPSAGDPQPLPQLKIWLREGTFPGTQSYFPVDNEEQQRDDAPQSATTATTTTTTAATTTVSNETKDDANKDEDAGIEADGHEDPLVAALSEQSAKLSLNPQPPAREDDKDDNDDKDDDEEEEEAK